MAASSSRALVVWLLDGGRSYTSTKKDPGTARQPQQQHTPAPPLDMHRHTARDEQEQPPKPCE
jgi:hypothetical protein